MEHRRPLRPSFPWSEVLFALLVGLPALAIATVVALVATSHFAASYLHIFEINGRVYGTWADTPILLLIATAFGAVGIASARKAWSAISAWRFGHSASEATHLGESH